MKIINLIIAGLSFIFGLFIAKRIGDADKLKIQVKQFEDNQKEQNEILQRNIDIDNAVNAKLLVKKARTRNK
jgi:hypothetical protein